MHLQIQVDVFDNLIVKGIVICKMSDGHRMSGPHIIKLHDKRIRVQLQYHSPPKREERGRVRNITLFEGSGASKEPPAKKVRNLNSFKSIKRIKLIKLSPFFYKKAIQESSTLLADYERFHQRMIENQPEPQKLKVYSNSKELKMEEASRILANKDTNAQHTKPNHKVPLRKIKLYSPIKPHHTSAEKPIAMQDSAQPRHIVLRGTPERRRKLEVTSSKSRHKQDSLLSKDQKSLDTSKQARLKLEEETPQRFLKSFHSLSLHEH